MWVKSPARCCTQQPLRLHIHQQMQTRAVRTGSCTQEGQWDAWTCPTSSGWSGNRLHVQGRQDKSNIFQLIVCAMNSPLLFWCLSVARHTGNVDGGNEGSSKSETLRQGGGGETSTHQHQTSNCRQTWPRRTRNVTKNTNIRFLCVILDRLLTWDGVGNGHEGGVQSRRHAPHSVVSHNPSQAKCCDHLSEGCIWRDDPQSQTCGHTYRETKQSRAVVAVVMFLSLFTIFPYCCNGNFYFYFLQTMKAMKREKQALLYFQCDDS